MLERPVQPAEPATAVAPDAVVIHALDRPDHGNALDPGAVERLDAALTAAEAASAVVAFVITARGKAFCAGADVKASAALLARPDELLHFFDTAGAVLTRLRDSRLVTVAAVQGLAAAGGLELVAACDVVIAGRSARFADRHARYGFVPSFGATARLPRRLPRAVAAWLLLADGELTADEAQAAGFVSRVVDDAALADAVAELCARFARLDGAALAAIKSTLAEDDAERQALRSEREAVRRHLDAGGYRATTVGR